MAEPKHSLDSSALQFEIRLRQHAFFGAPQATMEHDCSQAGNPIQT